MSRLQELLVFVLASQDAAERTAAFPAFFDHVDDLAQELLADEPTFSKRAMKIAAVPKMKGRIDKLVRSVRQRAKELEADRTHAAGNVEMASLDSLTRGLGVEGLMSPRGYQVTPTGIWLGKDERIAERPVVLFDILIDLQTKRVQWHVACLYRGKWCRKLIDREAGRNRQQLGALAAYGFPVSSENAAALVQYLTEFETANEAMIDDRSVTSRLGWLRPGVFQLGAECIGDNVLLDPSADQHLASGFAVRGDWETWCSMIGDSIRGRPLVQLALYASASACLLEPLNLDGFVIDWSGATSRGKTSALRVAGSVWGDPTRLIGSWQTASEVGPQERAAFLHSLPVILDETKHLGDDNRGIVASMLYAIPAGRDKMRGRAEGGLRAAKTWRTVLLSTGEKAVTDFTKDAGARARALCIRGAPFGRDSTENRQATERLAREVREHHGHLGRLLVEHLVREADPVALRTQFNEYLDSYASEADGSVSRRLAAPVALLRLTAELCHDLGCPGRHEMDAALDAAWSAALQGGANSDRPAAAWHSLYAWCGSHRNRFKGPQMPHQGWAGSWDRNDHGTWKVLAIIPEVVHKLLDEWGYDREYVINEWARRDWMKTDKGRRQGRASIGGTQMRAYVFPVDKVAELLREIKQEEGDDEPRSRA